MKTNENVWNRRKKHEKKKKNVNKKERQKRQEKNMDLGLFTKS